jgi:hypothetical protein
LRSGRNTKIPIRFRYILLSLESSNTNSKCSIKELDLQTLM